ncbi:hypothetical protein R3P38DRAFT_3027219 [Favolaschia claudopus]|uniref:Gag protein n=1 Tax=Favolaschia claudopus TaxID=2862362 RepID=A0AAW0AG42_9AGAR
MSTIPNAPRGSFPQNGIPVARGHRGGRSQHRTSRGAAPFQGPVDSANPLDNPRGGFPAHSRSGGQGRRGRGRGRARGSGVQHHTRGSAPFQNHLDPNPLNDFAGPTWTRGSPRGRGIQYHARGSATSFQSPIQSDWVDIPGGGGDQATSIRGRARGRGRGHGIGYLSRGAAPFQSSVDAEAIVNIPRGRGRGHSSAGGRRGTGNARGRIRRMNRSTAGTVVLPQAADGQSAIPTVDGRGRGTQGRRPRGGGTRGGRGGRERPSDNHTTAPPPAQVLPQAENNLTHGGSEVTPALEVDDDHAASDPRPFTPPPPPEWNINLLPMTEQTAILDQWLKDLESKLETHSDIPRGQWVDIAIDLLGSDEALRATEFEFDLERRGDERWDSFVQKLLRIYSGVGRDPASGAGKRSKGKARARGEGRHINGGGHGRVGGVAQTAILQSRGANADEAQDQFVPRIIASSLASECLAESVSSQYQGRTV